MVELSGFLRDFSLPVKPIMPEIQHGFVLLYGQVPSK